MQNNITATSPNKDYGFFGPDSVTWKVFQHPAAFSVGFQRTVITEMFEPFLLASVTDTEAVLKRPAVRYDRTLQYVSTVAFADSDTVLKASSILYTIHSHIRGNEPISGLQYDANEPEAQLWIHLTQWHSVLLAYEIFGPGKLSEAEENQYWAECRRAAAFQTIDPETVPANREEMRAYYERMRPRMGATIDTQKTVTHLLDAHATLLEKLPAAFKPLAPQIQKTMRQATVATLPKWMRKLGGMQQTAAEDRIAITKMRMVFKLMESLSPQRKLQIVELVSPATAKVVAPAILGITPECENTLTPAEAWANYDKLTPRAQYLALQKQKKPRAQAHAPKDKGAEHLLQFA